MATASASSAPPSPSCRTHGDRPLLAMASGQRRPASTRVDRRFLTARPRHEPLTLLAAVAARTRRVRLGTAVLLPALRPPVVLAHIVGTLDRVAEGRLILGVGIATDTPAIRKEFAAAGVPFERRVGRFLETLEICGGPWGGDGGSVRRQALHLGSDMERSRSAAADHLERRTGQRAARGRRSTLFPTAPTWFFAEQFPLIQAAARAAGRPPDAVTGAAYVTLALAPNVATAERRLHGFLETYYAAPARAIMARQATYAGPLEGCVEWLQRWIAAGCRHLMIRFAGGDQLAQVDETATRLLPRLRTR